MTLKEALAENGVACQELTNYNVTAYEDEEIGGIVCMIHVGGMPPHNRYYARNEDEAIGHVCQLHGYSDTGWYDAYEEI